MEFIDIKLAEKINNTSIKNRVLGFKEGLQVSGIQIDESAVLDCPYDLSASKDISLKLLHQKHRPTAVFVTTELLGLQSHSRLKKWEKRQLNC
ncbi:hypothetical protein P9D98_10070 [Bacillus mojavensis]|uniref:hypothetical protein n=1 Tax=Bacillus mojavensis TaxID=72360 RepID=UPI002DBE9F4B|nr:hypothetical protein [Bacillus mojavensis]MEC1635016.1 hypothetical protein [Bacillus mojavensis]